jgi:hypothetical protein
VAASGQKLRQWIAGMCMRLLCGGVYDGLAENLPGAGKTMESHFVHINQTAPAWFRGPGDGCRLPQAAFVRRRCGNSRRHE